MTNNIKPIAGLCPATLLVAGLINNCCVSPLRLYRFYECKGSTVSGNNEKPIQNSDRQENWGRALGSASKKLMRSSKRSLVFVEPKAAAKVSVGVMLLLTIASNDSASNKPSKCWAAQRSARSSRSSSNSYNKACVFGNQGMIWRKQPSQKNQNVSR